MITEFLLLTFRMNLNFNLSLAEGYKSKSQVARVLTEGWVKENSYCPHCQRSSIIEFENNRAVADFQCPSCNEEFELKSKSGKLGSTIVDGAYSTMMERIQASNNPNFFFLTYTPEWTVSNFLIIPKQFFIPEIIVRRNPLPVTARRAGWVGCNIDLSQIADYGKVFLVKDSEIVKPYHVAENFKRTLFIREKSSESRGWLLDVMACVDRIPEQTFTLNQVYAFEEELKLKHPNNNFVKDKIRQQLQVMRDNGLLEFVARGQYRKVK